MLIDEFIITAFCLVEARVEELTGGVKRRTRGLAPRLNDSEVIPMEMVGEWLGYASDEAIWESFQRQGAAWFPGLGDRDHDPGCPGR